MHFQRHLHRVAALPAALGLGLAVSAPARADQVFADDVIVQGSLCVGVDCVNGENFGFDTVILKENNLRVFFNDTSASGSFPANDWRIVINDTNNGGANYFAVQDATSNGIPFRIKAGANTNSLVVDSDGDIGIKTLSPAVDIHVVEGNTPTLRLEQDGSDGFAAQTWDVAGNEANFFVRDVNHSSHLPFRIKPGSGTDNALFIAANGDIGMGTDGPSAALDVLNSGSNMTIASFHGSGVQLLDLKSDNNNAAQYRMISDSGNRRFVGLNSSGSVETQMVFGNNEIQLAGPTNSGANLWLRVNASGIFTKGPSCNPGPCDGTFDPAQFDVPSIEEHAAYMWDNKHLWGVGATTSDQPYNLTEKTAGMLHELEVAHIYIEQLNRRIDALEAAALER